MAPDHLREAAARKHEESVARTKHALRAMARAGQPISFASVSRRASVSRQWLYEQADLRAEIERLRDEVSRSVGVPAAQRASAASERARRLAVEARLRDVLAENRRLRDELAHLHGERLARRP